MINTTVIRAIVFTGGPRIDDQVLTFIDRLEREPTVALVGIFSESPLLGLGGTAKDLVKRRGMMALPLLGRLALSRCWEAIRRPEARRNRARILAEVSTRLHYVEDLHHPRVIDQIQKLACDLGLVYGGPILKSALFSLPSRGTLGIHHGSLPEYRGKKTTFWAIYNGEERVGVTIQRIGGRLDGGDIVAQAKVRVAGRRLSLVKQHLEQVGIDLYLQAVRAVGDASITYSPQPTNRTKIYRDPTAMDMLRFWRRALRRSFRPEPPATTLRICLVTETFYPVTGGGESQAKALALGLADSGASVRVITRRSDPSLLRQDRLGPVVIRRLGPSGSGPAKKWWFSMLVFITLMRTARSYDTVLVCGFRVLGLPVVSATKLCRKTCVLKADLLGEFSGAVFQRRMSDAGLNGEVGFLQRLLKLRTAALRHATRFVAISQPVEHELISGGVNRERIVRIPNSVDTTVFRPVDAIEKQHLRDKLGIEPTHSLVVYTGRLETTKGLPVLLKAWAIVMTMHPEAHLLLVGSGGIGAHNCESELRDYVVRNDLTADVTFAGSVHNVHEYLQSADVFVFPSEREAFGISVIEAMSCGLRVVTTAPGGLAEIVEGTPALLVPVGDVDSLALTIHRALAEKATESPTGGRTVVEERYAEPAVVARYHQLLSQTVRPEHHA